MTRAEPPGTPLPEGEKAIDRLRDGKSWPLLDAVRGRWADGRPLIQNLGLPSLVEVNVKLNVDVEKWGTGFLSVRDREPPGDLSSALREVTPQALLRDLFRPEMQFPFQSEVKEGMFRPPLTETYRSIRAAQQREPLPSIEPLSTVVRESQERRRRFLSERWQPHRPDDAPRAALELFPSGSNAPVDD